MVRSSFGLSGKLKTWISVISTTISLVCMCMCVCVHLCAVVKKLLCKHDTIISRVCHMYKTYTLRPRSIAMIKYCRYAAAVTEMLVDTTW